MNPAEVKFKRLKPRDVKGPEVGKYKIGPEFHGCCGTGTRPVLFKEDARRYVVCDAENDLIEALSFFIRNPKRRAGKSNTKRKRNQFWRYKTRAAAVRKFVDLCNERFAENERAKNEEWEELNSALCGILGMPE